MKTMNRFNKFFLGFCKYLCFVICFTVLGFAIGLNAQGVFGADGKDNLKNCQGLFPPNVKTIAIVSPAELPRTQGIQDIVRCLTTSGFKVKVMPHAQRKTADPKEKVPFADRFADFTAAWFDPEVDLIWSAAGGSGSEELVPRLPWNKLAQRPDLPLVGFSNVTFLICAMEKMGAGHPIYGPNAANGSLDYPATFRHLSDVLNGKPPEPFQLKIINPGKAAGKPFGGYLSALESTMKMGFMPDTRDRVLFIEYARAPKDVLKYLESLRKHGFFNGCAGVVFGQMLDWETRTPQAVDEQLTAFAKTLDCPVWGGYPFGHDPKTNYAIDFRRTVTIDEKGILR